MDTAIHAMIVDGARVDLLRHEVQQDSETVRLSPQEVSILKAFASRGEDVTLTRLELYREAWGYSREPQGRALDYAMRRLREKLGATNPTGSILGTVRGVGYRLVWSPASTPTASSETPVPVDSPESPLPATLELVGRDAIVAEGLERVTRPSALVTLLGPGGIGKSSVATAIGHRLADHWRVWVDLEAAAIGEAQDAIARALFPPGDSEDAFEARIGNLLAVRKQPIALFLDGAERHLDELSTVLSPLGYPRLKVLLTSRERLLLRRETVLQIPPLSLEAAETLIRSIAKRRGVPELHTEEGIQALLELLDGLPLAMELVGARLRTRSPADLARAIAAGRPLRTRERDRPDRHASMEAVVQSSVERLPTELQTALHDLTVFQGVFGLESAALAMGVDVYEAEEMVESLVDSSMLHFEEHEGAVAYRILRPTHTVLTRLRGPSQEARERLVADFDALGRTDPTRALGREGGALLRTLRPHAIDLAALADDHSLQRPGFALLTHLIFATIGMRAAKERVEKAILEHIRPESDLHRLVLSRAAGARTDGAESSELLAQMDEPAGPEARLMRMDILQEKPFEDEALESACRELLEDARRAGDHYVVGRACRLLGTVLVERNALDAAEGTFQGYLTAARTDDNLDNTVSAWSCLARVAFSRGDTAEAVRRLESARAVAGPTHRYAGVLLSNLGLVYLSGGQMEPAEEVTHAGRELARQHGNIGQVILSSGSLSEICLEVDKLDEAEHHAREALELALAHGSILHQADRIWSHLAVVECIRGNFHAARETQTRWYDRFGPSGSPISQALLMPVKAWIEAGLGESERAREMLATELPLSVAWRPGRDWLASQAAMQLGDLELASSYIDRVEALVAKTGTSGQILRRSRRTRERITALRAAGD